MNGAASPSRDSLWVRFWHQPVRAERLACMRICLAFALLTGELFEYLPNLGEFFGPEGAGPAGVHASTQMLSWKLSPLIFDTDNLTILYSVFALWVAVTVLFLLGWRTRWTNFALWFLTRCFIERNPALKNGADDTVQLGILLLLLTPCGRACRWTPCACASGAADGTSLGSAMVAACHPDTGLSHLSHDRPRQIAGRNVDE